MDNDTEELTSVPVPKPRRHNINGETNLNNKIAYENVSIDMINKNIRIKNENIQNNSKNKLQTNKLFLMSNASTTANANTNANANDVMCTPSTQILTNLNDLTNVPSKNQKNTSIHLDEVNKLSNIYNDDENENVNAKPVPAPRRSSNVKQFNCAPSTGAVNKQPTIDINDFIESPKMKVKSKSKSNKSSGSYSFVDDDCDSVKTDEFPSKMNLKQRLSNSSLDSSGSSNAEGNASKFHSASPG